MDKPLLWHQGLFLQPQHLQLKDKHDHCQFTPYYLHFKPHLKGVYKIEQNSFGLSNHLFSVRSGAFWFPDMTYVVLGENAVMEARDFRDLYPSDGGAMMVYVGLKGWLDDRPNVTEISDATTDIRTVDTRYAVIKEEKEIRDLHLGGAKAKVKRMVYVLRLFFGDEVSHAPNYHILPVAKVERRENNLLFSSVYVPPCVDIHAFDPLSDVVKSIATAVIGCSHDMGDFKRNRGLRHGEPGSKDMIHMLVLSTINRYAPYFHTLLTEKRIVHPYDVYEIIRQLTGELSTFSTDVNALGTLEHDIAFDNISDDDRVVSLPHYNHDDLWTCFTAAEKLLKHLVREITTGPDHVLDMVFADPYYSCAMDEALFKGDYTYYLVMRTAVNHKDVVNAADTNIKISAPSHMTMLVERSLPGIPVEHLPSAPQGLPRRTNGIYFKIDKSSKAFKSIRHEGRLTLFWYEPPEDLQLELMMVKEQ